MNELAINSGLSTPKTFYSIDIDIIKDKVVYPSIIKPKYTKPNIKGIIINSNSELELALKKEIFEQGYIIQEIIEGPETNIFVIGTYSDINGKIIAYGMGQTLRQNPSNFGTKTYLRSFDDKEILKLTQQFLKFTQYYGIADIEFKYSNKDNSFKFIEINPRVGSINNFFCSQSIELPVICYDELTNQNIYYLKSNYKKIIWMDIYSDIKLICARAPYPPSRLGLSPIDSTSKYFEEICGKNNIQFIDFNYLNNDEYIYTDFDFADYHHMNHLGAQKVTKQLSKYIFEIEKSK